MQQYQLIMYSVDDNDTALFCLSTLWEKEKEKLKGHCVNFARFPLINKSPTVIARKIMDCMEGNACPVGGGHLCLKK